MKKTKYARSAKDILAGVLELYRSYRNWTQHAFAKSKIGESVSPHSGQAVCFCLSGALIRIAGGSEGRGYGRARRLLIEAIFEHGKNIDIVGFNDAGSTKFRDVRKVLKLAHAKV